MWSLCKRLIDSDILKMKRYEGMNGINLSYYYPPRICLKEDESNSASSAVERLRGTLCYKAALVTPIKISKSIYSAIIFMCIEVLET